MEMQNALKQIEEVHFLVDEKMVGLQTSVEYDKQRLGFKTYLIIEPPEGVFENEELTLTGELVFSTMITNACNKHFKEIKTTLSSPLDILTVGLSKPTPSSVIQSFVEKDLGFLADEVVTEAFEAITSNHRLAKKLTSSSNPVSSRFGFLFVTIVSGEEGKNFYTYIYLVDVDAKDKKLIKVVLHK